MAGRFFIIGGVGLAIVAALNAIAAVFMDKPEAAPLTADWWSDWGPSFVIWTVCLAFGAIALIASRRR